MANNKHICINLAGLIGRTIDKLFPEYDIESLSEALSLPKLNGNISGDTINDQQLFGLLGRIRKLWNNATLDYPSKAGTDYLGRLKYWFRDNKKAGVQKTLALVPYCSTLVIGNITNISTRPNDKLLDLQLEINTANFVSSISINAVDMRDIIPLFNTYSGHFYTIIEYLMEYTERHLNSVQINDNVEFVGRTEYNSAEFSNTETKQPIQEQEKNMTKLNQTVTKVATTGKRSASLVKNAAIGNATNAAVKATLRPMLEPALRKMLQPKGLVQRTLGKAKVEDSVSAILDSPLMDVLSAAILLSITSSGLVTNEKFVAGAELACDAAAIKVANLIDFDALVSGLTEKITTLVSSLDTKEEV